MGIHIILAEKTWNLFVHKSLELMSLDCERIFNDATVPFCEMIEGSYFLHCRGFYKTFYIDYNAVLLCNEKRYSIMHIR